MCDSDRLLYLLTYRQLESKDASQPSWGFGSADRWASYNKELKANTTPGPGSYDPVA